MATRTIYSLAVLAAILTGTVFQPVYAQDPAAYDTTTTLWLDDLIREALRNNARLQADRTSARGLRTRRRQVAALPDPFASVSYQPFPVFTARGFQRSQWRIEQDVPFPGKLGLRGEIADFAADVAGFEADASAQDLVLEVSRAYFDLYRVQEQQRLIEAFREQLSDFVTAATGRYEVGGGLQQDILKAQLERNTLERLGLDLARRKRAAVETLAYLLNRPDTALLLDGTVSVERPESLLHEEAARRQALEQRPEVHALETTIRQAQAQTELARKAFLPDFTFGLNYFDIGASGLMPTMTGRDALALHVMVTVPLWRGKLDAKVEEARLFRREAESRLEDLRAEIETQTSDLVSRLDLERRTLLLYEQTLIPQAETTLEASLQAYTTGETDFLNLLDAERTLFDLRMGFQDSLVRYLQTRAALERALGTPPPDVLDGDA